MVKLIIFFRKPADVDAFEEYFSNTHVPLIAAMPNQKRTAVTRAIGAPRGEPPFHLIHEVYFADMPALTYALNSPEGRAAGADLMGFAREIVSLMFAEVWGEDPFELGLIGHEPAPAEEAASQATEPADEKSKLVPIDTSFLEKPAKPMTVEEAILGPDYKKAAPAEAPDEASEAVTEAPAVEAVEAAASSPSVGAASAVPIAESSVPESTATETPATPAPASSTVASELERGEDA